MHPAFFAGCFLILLINYSTARAMTHKQKCIQQCKDFLNSRNLSQYFNSADFEHIYRKFDGANGNAFSIGLSAADFIIFNAKPIPQDEIEYQNF
jgi:hypothetical protein